MRTDDLYGLTTYVMRKLLGGDADFLRVLKKQFEYAKINRIDFTGHGYYAYFETDSTYRICNPELENCDVSTIVGLDQGGNPIVGFVLFLADGLIHALEGFSIMTSEWPDADVTLVFPFMKDDSTVVGYSKVWPLKALQKYNAFDSVALRSLAQQASPIR